MKTALCALALLACGGQQFEGVDEAASSAGSSSSAGNDAGGGSSSGAGGSSSSAGNDAGAGDAGELVTGPPALCAELPITAHGSWTATASAQPFQVPKAIDGLPETRWSSEEPQAGTEWIQVDLGASVAINRVDVSCCVVVEGYPESLEDYGRELVIRLSETSEDFAAEPVASGPGIAGGTTFTFAPAVGRYLLVSQAGTHAVNWWSVHEISPACE